MRVQNLSSINYNPTRKTPSFKSSFQSEMPFINGAPRPRKTNLANSLFHQSVVAGHSLKAKQEKSSLKTSLIIADAIKSHAKKVQAQISNDVKKAQELAQILQETGFETAPEGVTVERTDGYYRCSIKDESYDTTFLKTIYYFNADTLELSSIEKSCIMQNHKQHTLYQIDFENKKALGLKDATNPIYYTSEEYIDKNTPDNRPRHRMEYMFDGEELKAFATCRITLEDYDDGLDNESFQFKNGKVSEITIGSPYRKGKKVYAFENDRLKIYSFEKYVDDGCRDFELKGYHAYYYDENGNVDKIALDHEGYSPICISANKLYEINGNNILLYKNAMIHNSDSIYATDTIKIK